MTTDNTNKPISKSEALNQLNKREEDKNISIVDELIYKNKERKGAKLKKTLQSFLITFFTGIGGFFTYTIKDKIESNMDLFANIDIISEGLNQYLWFIFNSITHPIEVISSEYLLEFLLIILLGLVGPILVATITFKYLSKIIYKNEIIILGNITKWEIKEITKEFIDFKLTSGKNLDDKELFNAIEPICRELGKSRAVVKTINKRVSRMIFEEHLPIIANNIPPVDIKNIWKPNRLFLGCNDLQGSPIYTPETVWRGGFERHGLIVGGSGSGKSYFFTSFMNNWLGSPEAYKNIDKIYIVNFKNSPDFDPFLKYDKVVHSGGSVESALRVFKKVELEMLKRNTYLKLNKIPDGRNLQKLIFIIDEMQTITEMSSAKGLSKVEKNSWAEIERILNTLSSKIRSTNGSIFGILQKATSTSIDTTVRANLTHRFSLLNDNGCFVLGGDREELEKKGIFPEKLQSGQMIYTDLQSNYIEPLFCQTIKGEDLDLTMENDSPEDKKIRVELDKTKDIVLKAQELLKQDIELVEREGRQTFCDTFSQAEEVEKDYIQIAIDYFKNPEKYLVQEEKKDTSPESLNREPEPLFDDNMLNLVNGSKNRFQGFKNNRNKK